MTLVEKAKALDAAIDAAGGMAAYFSADNNRRKDAGEHYYDVLIDPATNDVVARRDGS